MRRRAIVVEDSYEPGTLEVAWAEYRDAHAESNNPIGYATFRAGFRRGISQGALIGSSIAFHPTKGTSW